MARDTAQRDTSGAHGHGTVWRGGAERGGGLRELFEFFGEFREIEIQIVRRECGGMREEECIGGEAERRFFWKRFLFEDIQDGSADFPGAQKRDERIFVD